MDVETGGERMTPASGQELREPLKQPGKEALATCGGNSALPLSAAPGPKAEVMGSDYTVKTQFKPKRGHCLGKGRDGESHLHMEAGGLSALVVLKKYLFWRVRVWVGKQAKGFMKSFLAEESRITFKPQASHQVEGGCG